MKETDRQKREKTINPFSPLPRGCAKLVGVGMRCARDTSVCGAVVTIYCSSIGWTPLFHHSPFLPLELVCVGVRGRGLGWWWCGNASPSSLPTPTLPKVPGHALHPFCAQRVGTAGAGLAGINCLQLKRIQPKASSVCLSLCLSLSVSLCVSLSLCLCLSVGLSVCPSLSVCLSVCLSVSLSLSLSHRYTITGS